MSTMRTEDVDVVVADHVEDVEWDEEEETEHLVDVMDPGVVESVSTNASPVTPERKLIFYYIRIIRSEI